MVTVKIQRKCADTPNFLWNIRNLILLLSKCIIDRTFHGVMKSNHCFNVKHKFLVTDIRIEEAAKLPKDLSSLIHFTHK